MKELIELAVKSITIERNEFLKLGGSIDRNVYYIEEGSIRLFILDELEEQTIRFGYKDNLVVALDSFLTGNPSDLFIQAIKKTTVQIITKQQLDDYISVDSHKQQWITILEELVVQQLEREVDILTHSPQERLNRVMKRSPKLFQEIPQKHIANYLRMTPETLSRLKKS